MTATRLGGDGAALDDDLGRMKLILDVVRRRGVLVRGAVRVVADRDGRRQQGRQQRLQASAQPANVLDAASLQAPEPVQNQA